MIDIQQRRRWIVPKVLVLLLAMLGTGLAVPAAAFASTSCHMINATGVGQDNFDGTTTARIIDGGLLQGTTVGTFQPTGFDPPVASFSGQVVFTVNRGSLTAEVNGTLNTATGAFQATSASLSGTGKLAGATGFLTFEGTEDLSDGSFTETVTGEVCVDLSP